VRKKRARLDLTSAAVVAVGALLSACHARGPSENVLAGKQPARADGVGDAAQLTDGKLAAEGADWNAAGASIFTSERAHVDYDLGRPARIEAASLQGDDDYVVSVSDDGNSFRELWVARPVGTPGLRARSTDGLGTTARWIRLSARGGDRAFSVTELQLWTGALPATASRSSPDIAAARVRTRLVFLVLAFGLVLFATRRESSRGLVALLWLAPVAAAALAVAAIAAAWPLAAREVSATRACAAVIVLVALLRGWERARRAAPHQKTVLATCAFGAVLAFACFYNLGRPQFWHHAQRRPMFVHVDDMRIYQPFAKYFDELRFDGVYLACALAFAEDERGGSIESIGTTEVRDLRDFRIRRLNELRAEIAAVRQRFSDARWTEFKRDMTFFRASMGPHFLTGMTDHGANAPPAWVWLARLFIGHVPATETTMTIAGLLDAVLLLALAWAIRSSFGLMPMLVAMTVFGATSVYSFGTNWGGATLRHDWLVLLGFGACALRRERWLLAGALLGFGTALRVVPINGLLGIVALVAGWLVAQWVRRRRPGLRALLAEHGPAVRVLGAAAATIVATVLFTGLLYSFSAWSDWWARIKMLNESMADNEVDLRMLVAGVDQTAVGLLHAHRSLFVVTQIACVLVVVLAVHRRRLEDAMLLALPLSIVLMNTVNYHVHFVFLLPLLGARRGLLSFAAPMLVLCAAGYWTDLEPDFTRRFQMLTALVFATLGWLYFVVGLRAPERRIAK
jgi:hypothetical protein